MSAGTRSQPEKDLDARFKPRSYQRLSRKRDKTIQNRKDRRLARLDPETPPRAKYLGYEW